MMQPLSIVPAAPEDDFARTMRLCESVRDARAALQRATARFVTESRGALAERIRVASDMSGIPTGVISELLREAER